MFATEQRWCRVASSNKKRRISTSRERVVVRDILTEEHRTRKNPPDKIVEKIGNKTFLDDRFSSVANFRCENSEQCKNRVSPLRTGDLMERILLSAQPTNQF